MVSDLRSNSYWGKERGTYTDEWVGVEVPSSRVSRVAKIGLHSFVDLHNIALTLSHQ